MNKSYLFFAILLIHIGAALFDLESLEIASKVVLMPILIWHVWTVGSSYSQKIALILALLFSWFGDILLVFEGQLYFMLGLGAFLIAHLTYSFIYFKKFEWQPIRLLPFIGFIGLFCFGILNDALPDGLAIPVYVYMVVICIMAYFATCRNIKGESYEYVLLGAILFIISDAFIAVNQFLNAVPFSAFWVMTTYGLAQFFIVKGLLKEDLKG